MAVNPFLPGGGFVKKYKINDSKPKKKRRESDVDEYGNVINKDEEEYYYDPQGNRIYPKKGKGIKFKSLEEIKEEEKKKPFLERMKIERSKREGLYGSEQEFNPAMINDTTKLSNKSLFGREDAYKILEEKEKQIEEEREKLKERQKEAKSAKEKAKLKMEEIKLIAKRGGLKALKKGLPALAESKRIEATDIDFIVILIFAIIVDSVDSILTILQFITAFTIGEALSLGLDNLATFIITLWMLYRLREMARSKQQIVQQLQQRMGEKAKMMQKELKQIEQKATRAPLRRVLLRVVAGFILELIPLVGLIPWWTITVVLTLREK